MAEEVPTQRDRMMEVHTELDYDTLLIDSMSASEAISRPFRYELTLLADAYNGGFTSVDPEALVGTPMKVRVRLQDGNFRFYNGIVSRFSEYNHDHHYAYYRAELIPWVSFLTLTSDCRIFQDLSIPDIVTKVFTSNGYQKTTHFRWALSRDYTVADYCVQYRETDFNFISRLLEHEGISYYFEHDGEGHHVMVLTDSLQGAKDCPFQSGYLFQPATGFQENEDTITAWEVRRRLISGKWGMRDYHFESPRNPHEANEETLEPPAPSKKFELFDYPGEYAQKFNKPEARLGDVLPEGERITRMRAEQEETHRLVYCGFSNGRAMTPGFKIQVTGAHGSTGSRQYVLESVEHTVFQQPHYTARPENRTRFYANSFTCVPATVFYRPARTTPKPLAHGLQTGIVIDEQDPPKEEICPDKYGRVRVRFLWDREAKNACWIRVVQQWAGKGWGYQWIPRVGDEVLVGFLEGDPDCPLFGSLHNQENMPPFTLPANKSQSGIKTKSTPDGGPENYNLIRFEDKKGKEEILLHAEKQLTVEVEQDETHLVGGARTTEVEKNDVLTVNKGDRGAEITKGNDSLNVKAGGITIQAPAGTYKLDAMQVEITATSTIKLTCGGSTIEMTPGLIKIQSPFVKIN